MKWAVKFYFLFLVFLFTIIFTSMPIYADQSFETLKIKNEQINPGSFYYPFKRLWEKFRERMIFDSNSKINFNESLLKTRLAELNYVVERKFLSEIQTTSERFAYQAGILTDEVVKANRDKEKIVKEFDKFSKTLERLRDKYPANSSFWMLIQHDINTLNILAKGLK